MKNIAVLGGGNGALATAADLTLAGHNVNLFELPEFSQNLDPIIQAGGIEIRGAARNGFARIHGVTTDIRIALDNVDIVLIISPAYGHRMFAETVAPFLCDGQVVVLNPAYSFGAVQLTSVLRRQGVDLTKILIGSLSILVYAARKYLGNKVFVTAVKAAVPFTALPASNTSKVIKVLNDFFPQDDGKRGVLIPVLSELKTSIENTNLYAHAPIMILKAVEVENGGDPLTNTQSSNAVRNLTRAMNEEGMAITRAFGLEPWSQDYLLNQIMYPPWNKKLTSDFPDWVNTENKSKEYRQGSNLLEMRYITEDIPYGLVPLSEIGKIVSVPTPVIDSVITIGSIITNCDFRGTGRTLKKLGLSEMNKDTLLEFLS